MSKMAKASPNKVGRKFWVSFWQNVKMDFIKKIANSACVTILNLKLRVNSKSRKAALQHKPFYLPNPLI